MAKKLSIEDIKRAVLNDSVPSYDYFQRKIEIEWLRGHESYRTTLYVRYPDGHYDRFFYMCDYEINYQESNKFK